MTAITTEIAASRRTRGAHGPSVKTCVMRGSPRVSGPRPTSLYTMGRRTQEYGWRTTGSRATQVEQRMTSSSSRTCRSISRTLRGRGSSTCHGARSTIGQICVESLSATSRARTPAPASSGSCTAASRSWERVCATTSLTYPSVAPSSPARRTTTPSQCFKTARPAPPSSTN
jgi:hypothetical protein